MEDMGGIWSASAIFFLLQGTILGLVSHLPTLAKVSWQNPMLVCHPQWGSHLLKPRLRTHVLHFSYTCVFSFIWLWGQMWANRIIAIILVSCHFMPRCFNSEKCALPYITLLSTTKPWEYIFFKTCVFKIIPTQSTSLRRHLTIWNVMSTLQNVSAL